MGPTFTPVAPYKRLADSQRPSKPMIRLDVEIPDGCALTVASKAKHDCYLIDRKSPYRYEAPKAQEPDISALELLDILRAAWERTRAYDATELISPLLPDGKVTAGYVCSCGRSYLTVVERQACQARPTIFQPARVARIAAPDAVAATVTWRGGVEPLPMPLPLRREWWQGWNLGSITTTRPLLPRWAHRDTFPVRPPVPITLTRLW